MRQICHASGWGKHWLVNSCLMRHIWYIMRYKSTNQGLPHLETWHICLMRYLYATSWQWASYVYMSTNHKSFIILQYTFGKLVWWKKREKILASNFNFDKDWCFLIGCNEKLKVLTPATCSSSYLLVVKIWNFAL